MKTPKAGQHRTRATLILSSREQHEYVSVNIITKEILGSYRKALKSDLKVLHIETEASGEDLRQILSWLKKHPGGRVVFLNSAMESESIFKLLSFHRVLQPEIVIQLYGYFMGRPYLWQSLERHLLGMKVKWIVSCKRFKKILKEWAPTADVHEIGFPVSAGKTSTGKTTKWQFVYGGRFKGNKNIARLMEFLSEGYQENLYSLPSLVCGDTRPVDARSGVEIKGPLSQREFQKEILRSKSLISLSTYFMEFFGYSIAQALMLGRPVLITDWGGHQCFKNLKGVTFIKVTKERGGFQVNKAVFKRALKRHLKNRDPSSEIRKTARKKFSQDSIAGMYRELLFKKAKTFRGFSQSLHKDAKIFSRTGRISAESSEMFLRILSGQ